MPIHGAGSVNVFIRRKVCAVLQHLSANIAMVDALEKADMANLLVRELSADSSDRECKVPSTLRHECRYNNNRE